MLLLAYSFYRVLNFCHIIQSFSGNAFIFPYASTKKIKSINQQCKVGECNVKKHQRGWSSTVLFLFQKINLTRMSVKHSYCIWSSRTNIYEYIHAHKSLL